MKLLVSRDKSGKYCHSNIYSLLQSEMNNNLIIGSTAPGQSNISNGVVFPSHCSRLCNDATPTPILDVKMVDSLYLRHLSNLVSKNHGC